MSELEIIQVFTEEDIKFNKKMVELGYELQEQKRFPDRRGGKMNMYGQQGSSMFAGRDYDFTSEILAEFRRKWGIHE